MVCFYRDIINVCIERFWRSAKVEKIYLNEYFKISTLKNDVSDYMQFYNRKDFPDPWVGWSQV